MIYSKEATFPYPVLVHGCDDYIRNSFDLDVDLKEDVDHFYFKIEYSLDSSFVEGLIKEGRASLYFVIRSKDNKFYQISNGETISFPKSRMSLNKRTSLQLIVKANEPIEYGFNEDLDPYFHDLRSTIQVGKNNIIALSNVVTYDAPDRKPFDLFEKRVDESISSDIQIELGIETIIIVYKKEAYQFPENPHSRNLAYPYIYMGLQKALMRMIDVIGSKNDENDKVEELFLDESDRPEMPLYRKLYDLLLSKNIDSINYDEIDKVIYKITDNIIPKYTTTLERIYKDGN